MPVIPDFTAYAPAPNLAQSYLGGVRLAQEAADAAARIQLGYATLQQRAVENEMEVNARREIAAKEALRKTQEAEIDKAYRETQLGLAGRRLAEDERVTQMKLAQAANDFAAEQEYNRLIASGVEPQEAMRRVGFGRPGFATSLNPPNEPSPYPALNFQARQLAAQEEEIMRKYPGMTARVMKPEDKAALAEISRRRRELSPIQAPSTVTATNAPTKRLRFNPSTGEFE